jgi:hypothetical protein
MSRNIYFSNKIPHLTHEALYDNDISFKNNEGLKNNTVLNIIKTDNDLVVKSGFKGSAQD